MMIYTVLQDDPLKTWVDYRDDYLDECMLLEGRGPFYSFCAGCRSPESKYRCEDCTPGPLWCKVCLLARHGQLPLHLVEVRRIVADNFFSISVVFFNDMDCTSRCGTDLFFNG
jgi:hypothetical protein